MEPPDRLEKGIRFGCGFLFGCLVAIGALLTSLWNAHTIAAVCTRWIALRRGGREARRHVLGQCASMVDMVVAGRNFSPRSWR